MELLSYIIVLGVCVGVAISGPPPTKPYVLLCILLFFAISVVVRVSGYDSDISVYAERMSLTEDGIYFYREPILWYSQRILFNTIQSEVATLLIGDFVVYILFCLGLRAFGAPAYAYLAIILFFPFVLGMQNIYRQWVASAFLFWAVGRSAHSERQAMIGYALAVLTHNASFFFLPAVLARSKFRYFILAAWVILVPLGLWLGQGTRMASHTGADLGLAYLAVFALMCLAWWLLNWSQAGKLTNPEFLTLIFLTYLVGIGVLILPSSGAERIGLFGLVVVYPVLLRAIEVNLCAPPFRVLFAVSGFVPLFLFGTRQFLL